MSCQLSCVPQGTICVPPESPELKAPESPEACVPETGAPETGTPETGVPDMPDSVLDGVLGEVCQTHMPQYPLAYSWGSLVAAAGALVPTPVSGKATVIDTHADGSESLIINPSQIRTNIYWCAVGEKGTGKTQSMEHAAAIAGVQNTPMWLELNVGSAEGLADALKDYAGQNCIIYPDEMAHLLEKANAEHASLPYILNTMHGRNKGQLRTADKVRSFDANLSIVGGTTNNLFPESFGLKTAEGLYDRFLFGLCPEPWQFNYYPHGTENVIFTPHQVTVNFDVYDAKTDWLKAGVSSRVAELALRVAYICACHDNRELAAKDLAPALAFAKYQTWIRTILKPSLAVRDNAKIEDAIRRRLSINAGAWVSRSTIYRASHAERYGTPAFLSSLIALLKMGEIERDKKGNGEYFRLKGEA